jgi:hypothetical protein
VSPFPRLSRSSPVGVALGPDRLTAARASRDRSSKRDGEVWSRPLTPVGGQATGWLDLIDVLRELREALGPAPGRLHVALLPALVQIRSIDLPSLREDELRTVLTRDAGRYILRAGATQVVGTLAGDRLRLPIPYVAAFADAQLVDSVYAAAEAAGWGLDRIIPACSAWEAGVREHVAGGKDSEGYLLVPGPSHLDAMRFRSGRLDLCRRFPRGMTPEQVIERLVEHASPPPWFILAGPPDETREFTLELQSRGLSLLESAGDTLWEDPLDALAATWAHNAMGPALVPDRIWIERQRRARRLSHQLLAGSAALLLLSAGLELWGTQRELSALRDQRSVIRGTVSQAMQLRESMQGIEGRLTALAAAEAGASHWSGNIADVAEHLPADAHLISMRGTGDSLLLDGVASRSAGVFESLQQSPAVAGVRAEAPIRQEAQDSGAPVERFSLGARLATTAASSRGRR